jgi:tRNA pseudouridine32 synthase/23S rRNA pseudouridine746 synthase
VIVFAPQPAASEVPERLPSPFATAPHPLARRAVAELLARVPAAAAEGKMFGVLVARGPAGIGYLCAFSGMLGGSWHADGFAPPAFDAAARAAFWPAGEAELDALAARRDALARDPAYAALAAMLATHAAELAALGARHAERKAERHAQRATGARAELDQQSRADKAERRRLDERHAGERAALDAQVAQLDADIAAIDQQRADRSRALLIGLQDTYAFANARGERRTLRELFAPASPPGGAGDCAAPKLFAQAYREGLTPIALAEVWCGAPPATGGRHAGTCYPACRGKCGPILAHVIGGLAAEPLPVFGANAIDAAEPRVVFEDARLAVVAKPIGLLSVPGRSGLLRDSVATRLRARWGDAHVVHRLDLDVSGVMLVAKNAATHAALQAQFARREIDKRYIAIVDGDVRGAGTIELPLRVDLDDRPRQIVDPVHGKLAVTEWRALASAAGGSRVALVPRTGRTHQLRVHCAHPLGLGAPIVGDRLYGRAPGDARMLLHAEAIAFQHPHTGERLAFELAAPF